MDIRPIDTNCDSKEMEDSHEKTVYQRTDEEPH